MSPIQLIDIMALTVTGFAIQGKLLAQRAPERTRSARWTDGDSARMLRVRRLVTQYPQTTILMVLLSVLIQS